MGTGFVDKNNKEIKLGDCLLFDNGSKYVVLKHEKGFVLRNMCITGTSLLINKITFGNKFCSAIIIDETEV